MKRIRDWGFVFLLMASVFLVGCCFVYASANREAEKLGGAVFMIALPIALVRMKLKAVERENQRKQMRLKKYQSRISTPMYM